MTSTIDITEMYYSVINKQRRKWKQYLNKEFIYERDYLRYKDEYGREYRLINEIIQSKWNARKLSRLLKNKLEDNRKVNKI